MTKYNTKYYVALVVALMAFALYLPALRNGFVNWDDNDYVYDNPGIRTLNWNFVRWAFTSFHASNWHPLTWASHAVDYAVWGLNPVGHHLTNIILHGLNTFLVVLLTIKLLEIWKERTTPDQSSLFSDEGGILIAAGVTGLLFGLHPAHVESVVWVSERKDLLCGLFYLLSISAYTSYGAASLPFSLSSALHAGGGMGRYLLCLFFFILALLSKPMAVSLPFVLLILDWFPLQRYNSGRSFMDALFEKIPFIAMSFLSSVLTIKAQEMGGAVSTLKEIPFDERLLVAAKALMVYLLKMAVPVHLLPIYIYPKGASLWSPVYFAAVLSVLGLTLLCIWFAKRKKILLFVWGYYLITLLPVLGLLQVGNQAMADRYTYLPSLGPFLVGGIGASWLWNLERIKKKKAGAVKLLVSFTLLCLCITLSRLTLKQITVWSDSIGLWSYVIENEPGSVALAHNNRGMAFKEKGQLDRALEDYNTAIQIDPALSLAYNGRGAVLRETGRLREAIKDYTVSISLDPTGFAAYNNRGIAFMLGGQIEAAIADFNKALSLNPGYADAYNNRGRAYMETGRSELAMEDYNRAVSTAPFSADAYNNRGMLLGQSGQLAGAIDDFTKAILVNPSGVEAYYNRAFAFEQIGRVDRAIDDYGRALGLKPDLVNAHLGRGRLYAQKGSPELAAKEFQKACELGNKAGCEALRMISDR